jgi:hypothetical protein
MLQVQYIVNDKGKRISAIVPIDEWKMLMKHHRKYLNKREVLRGIKESLEEIKHARQTGEKLQTFDDFLDEIKSIQSASEQVLAKDWLNEVEDEAWKNL